MRDLFALIVFGILAIAILGLALYFEVAWPIWVGFVASMFISWIVTVLISEIVALIQSPPRDDPSFASVFKILISVGGIWFIFWAIWENADRSWVAIATTTMFLPLWSKVIKGGVSERLERRSKRS